MRLQGVEEDGEEIEGLVPKLAEEFEKLGIKLEDLDGQLRSPYEILGDLAKKWDTLTVAQKAYYTELVAGKTRANVASAVISNFSRAIEATETAYNSAGSAAEENAKVIDSLNGHLNKLKATWESLVNSKGTQDALKLILDLASGILNLTKVFGGLHTVLTQIIVLLMVSKLPAIFTAIGDAGVGASAGLVTLGNTFAALRISGLALKASLFGIIAVIGLLASSLVELNQKEKQRMEESISGSDENIKKIETLKELSNEYKQLSSTTNKTISENERLAEIEQSLAGLLGEKSVALKNVTKDTDEYKKALIELSGAEKELLLIKVGQAKADAIKSVEKVVKPVFGKPDVGLIDTDIEAGRIHTKGEIRELLEKEGITKGGIVESVLDAYRKFSRSKISQFSLGVEQYVSYKDVLESLNKEYYRLIANGEEDAAQKIIESKLYADLTQRVSDLQEGVETFVDTTLTQKKELSNVSDGIIDTEEEYDNLITSIEEDNKLTETQKKLLKEAAEQDYPQFADAVNNASEVIDEAATSESKLSEAIKTFEKDATSNQKAFEALNSAAEEYNDNGFISVETLTSLKKDYPEFLDLLLEHKGDIKAVTLALKEKTEASYADALGMLEDKKAALETSLVFTDLTKDIAGYTEQLIILSKIRDVNKDIDYINAIRGALFNKPDDKGNKDPWKDAFTAEYNALKHQLSMNYITEKEYTDTLEALYKKYFANRSKYLDDYNKYEEEVYKNRQSLFKDEISDIEHSIDLLSSAGESGEERIALYKQLQEKVHAQAEEYRKRGINDEDALIQDLQKMWWQYAKAIGDIQKEIEDDTTEKFKKIKDAAIDIIEDQIDEQEKLLEDLNKPIQERIDSYKEEEDLLNDQAEIEEKLLKIEEARKKLAEAKTKKVRVYREGRGFVYETDFDAVSEAQEELNSLLNEWNLFQDKARIAEIIAGLEDEKEANEKRVNAEIEDLNKLKDAWDKSLDIAQNVDDYKGFLQELQSAENTSLEERLSAVREFVDAYNAEMGSMIGEASASSKAQTGGSSSRSSGGGGGFDSSTDYQAIINKAEASGDTRTAALAEAARNNKIDALGLSYEKTHKYTDPKTNVPSGLAGGTTKADGLMHLVGENGPELYVPPEGSGIIPNTDTLNLMAWSSINPMDLVSRIAQGNSGTSISVGNISLPNVTNASTFVEELKNFKGFAIQKQSVRR